MQQVLDDLFKMLNQGLAAVNAAKTSESGTPTGVTAVARPVTQSSTPWNLIGGLAVGGLILYFVMKRR